MDVINSTILLMLEIALEVVSIYLLFWIILEYLLRLVKNDGLYYQLSFYIPQIRNVVWVFYISYLFLLLIDFQLIFGSIVLICFLIIKWKYELSIITISNTIFKKRNCK